MKRAYFAILALTGFIATLNLQAELVLHWALEEGTGTTTADLSGNGHTGGFITINSSNWSDADLAPIPSGTSYAIYKPIINGRVEVNDGYKGVLGTQPRTVSAWIKTTETSGYITHWGNSALGEKFSFRFQSSDVIGALRVEIHTGAIVGTTPVNDNQWHHVMLVLPPEDTPDAIDVRLYVDGKLEGYSYRNSTPVNTVANDNMYAGGSMLGSFDDVRIYDHALNVVEINALAGVSDPYADIIIADAPEAWWRLSENGGIRAVNEGSVMSYTDGSKANFDASDYAVPGLIACNSNQALRFDGVDDRINFPDHESLNTGAGYPAKTIESWFAVAPFATNDPYRVIYEQGGSTHGFNQYVERNPTNYLFRSGAWSSKGGVIFPKLFTQTPIETGKVYHAVALYDGSRTRLTSFLNGAYAASLSNRQLTDVSSHGDNVCIGAINGFTLFQETTLDATASFNGVIDDVATYNKALTFERIQEHYIIGSGDTLGLRDGVTRGVQLNFDADNEALSGATFIKDSIGSFSDTGDTNIFDWVLNGVQRIAVTDHRFAGITNAWHFNGNAGATATAWRYLAGETYEDSASIEIVFRPADLIGNEVLFETGGVAEGMSLALNGSQLWLHLRDATTNTVNAVFDLNELSLSQRSAFIHAVGIMDIDNNSAKLYVNGELRSEAQIDEGELLVWTGNNNAGLGTVNGAVASPVELTSFYGNIALLRLYPSILTPEQILTNYQALTPRVFEEGSMLLVR